ncbi:MAG: tripartite tricarboxylate transporter substrate binding protein [Burkholderiales bacterium]|nr:tripartite tricarboxylate transporter substrate binding protein [Burkholderiales bacterium]
MRDALTVCGMVMMAGFASGAQAQGFPAKQMRMVVPAAPGGSADLLARLIAERLQKRLGQVVVTENRSGAGQTIGSALVAKSDPDGHTLLLVTVSYTTSAAIYSRLPYDPVTDLRGVAMVGVGPLLVTVHPSLPVKSVKELVALARSRPGQLDYGSAGTGTIPHLATELFLDAAKVKLIHVPYKGIAAAVTGTVAGEVPVLFGSTPSAGPMVKTGRLRAIAVTTGRRSPFMPELPTVAEAGVPGYDVPTWWGILVPAKTPDAVVERLNDEIRGILAIDEVRARVVAEGAEPELAMTAGKFNALIRSDIAKWRRLVKERDIQTQ